MPPCICRCVRRWRNDLPIFSCWLPHNRRSNTPVRKGLLCPIEPTEIQDSRRGTMVHLRHRPQHQLPPPRQNPRFHILGLHCQIRKLHMGKTHWTCTDAGEECIPPRPMPCTPTTLHPHIHFGQNMVYRTDIHRPWHLYPTNVCCHVFHI